MRDAESATASATITLNVLNVEDGPLTDAQKEFVEEYIYLTYKLSPTASGGTLSEKWQGVLNVYIEGVSDSYLNTLNSFLDEYRGFITDGTAIQLVNTAAEANVHVIFGPTEAVREQWPDMYEFIKSNQFGGYALYNSTFDNYIFQGRIWMGYEDEGLFKHEFGHIIGLGHTSDQYCADEITSVMCSGAAQEFNDFDREIIKTLYHPDTPVGLTTIQMREHVEGFIVANGVEL
ncbi:hypothetical protein GCM10011414_06610 [Croceivirga lutea]|uniref:hypothetical protein n=1 Tax=Croceivirga lutea TaxID=1775167 RepID=UPI00163A93DD|nr:hypothetical protein [Croceivirga lutea]GGG39827.1 hypothetical protein GCM10011414_06610 [Croceivirga lutea]